MKDWSVYVEAIGVPERGPGRYTEAFAEALLDALADRSPAVSFDTHSISARFSLLADSPETATQEGLNAFMMAMREAGARGEVERIRFEMEPAEDLDRRVLESNAPDLVGVHEIAELLGVTKQRASDLASSDGFPRSVANLASGRVWRKSDIARYTQAWPRKRGRPTLLDEFHQVLRSAMAEPIGRPGRGEQFLVTDPKLGLQIPLSRSDARELLRLADAREDDPEPAGLFDLMEAKLGLRAEQVKWYRVEIDVTFDPPWSVSRSAFEAAISRVESRRIMEPEIGWVGRRRAKVILPSAGVDPLSASESAAEVVRRRAVYDAGVAPENATRVSVSNVSLMNPQPQI
jgi:hypothetical protein